MGSEGWGVTVLELALFKIPIIILALIKIRKW